MDGDLQATLLKLLLPAAGIAAVLFGTRRRGMSWHAERGLGLQWPRAAQAAGWMAAWIAWMALTEFAGGWLGVEQPARWGEHSALVFVLRVLAIGLLGPAMEELVMRGAGIALLRRTRLGARGAVVVTAAAWAVLHVQYAPLLIGMIFLDGLFLGACRVRTGSLALPIAMHALGNLFSIWQSTHG
ncbi:MAG TPA: CPBP family intramembrane glutamic endopeptidase [Planctomycetota bacterium]|nr:CPBP family intramembrane glutamic endopeptidase [Planctomycetota bacterium]